MKKPNDAFLLYLQADILTRRGPAPGSAEFREAVASAKRAIASRRPWWHRVTCSQSSTCKRGENEAASEQSRKALLIDPKDQTALYHLIQGLRKSGRTNEIPELLKQLVDLRMAATKEDAKRNRYALVEGESPSAGELQP